MRFISTICVLCLSVEALVGQLGGVGTFEFLNLAPSARITALGGYSSTLRDDDINVALLNPAALNQGTAGQLAINHNFHIADINHGYFAYGFDIDSIGLNLAIGGQYVSYGEFIRADARDNILGTFNAAEYALTLSAAKLISDRLSVGTTVKLIRSDLDVYNSIGVALDLGVQYLKPDDGVIWSLVVRNIGLQLSQFSENRESLPTDIQIGYAKKLAHLPFKFLVTARDLQRWDIRESVRVEDDPIFINQMTSEESGLQVFTNNLFRHLVFGGEFIIGQKEALRLRFGYNHQRNQELRSNVFRSFGGFSFGVGIKLKQFRLDYGLGNYHLSGGVNHLSVIIDLGHKERLF
jgi:hypothetical protein